MLPQLRFFMLHFNAHLEHESPKYGSLWLQTLQRGSLTGLTAVNDP